MASGDKSSRTPHFPTKGGLEIRAFGIIDLCTSAPLDFP